MLGIHLDLCSQYHIKDVLTSEVLKRDVLEGEKALQAVKKISRTNNKVLRAKKNAAEVNDKSAHTDVHDSTEAA